jgi:hypothetical protein
VEVMTTLEAHCLSVRDNPHDSPVLHRIEDGQGSSSLCKNFTTVEKVQGLALLRLGCRPTDGSDSPGGLEKMRCAGKEWTP